MVRAVIPGGAHGAGFTFDVPVPGQTQAVGPLFDAALTLAAMGMYAEALRTLRDVSVRVPDFAPAWRKLAAILPLAGKDGAAAAALKQAALGHDDLPGWPPPVDTRAPAAFAAAEARLHEALAGLTPAEYAARLRGLLQANARAVAAMHLLARLEWEAGDFLTARGLLERAVALAPGYTGCRMDLIRLLMELSCFPLALTEIDMLVSREPRNVAFRALRADALRSVGDLTTAIALTEELLAEGQRNPKSLCVYAQALHFAGRSAEAARTYREAIAAAPQTAAGYWGLAELRGLYLSSGDIAGMRAVLTRQDMEPESRAMLLYALGHALESAGTFAESFAAYRDGAAIFHDLAAGTPYAFDADASRTLVERHKAVFSAQFFGSRSVARLAIPPAGQPTPIFIVGMPRSGSTLVEQILACHSLVEATLELPIIEGIARDLNNSRLMIRPDCYPECVPELTGSELAALGERYITESASYRRTAQPYFVDKCPANWRDVGLIHLILPHALIIDIRREAMASCFAMFKQVLLGKSGFSYDLQDLARYYGDYTHLMRHWDSVLPGRVHHLPYERLVLDTQAEIRHLLDHCGLPFEDGCLRFWESDRAVATPSAAQVRRPVFRDALDQWRHFEPWLDTLKVALASAGSVATD